MQVTYIARGDVPLSVVMTICTTFAAVFATPLLTQFLAGAYVPVDAAGLAISTLQVTFFCILNAAFSTSSCTLCLLLKHCLAYAQVVFAPVVLGAWMQSTFPKVVAKIIPYSPLAAVLISSLLASR